MEGIRVDRWLQTQPSSAWKKRRLRQVERGFLEVEILHRQVWVWDKKGAQTQQWHLIVRREIEAPTEITYSFSNAPQNTPTQRLAVMQGQRYFVERALQDAKSQVGMSHYQVRKYRGWQHHMLLCMLALLFTAQVRKEHRTLYPLLSAYDVRILMLHFLPKRNCTTEEVLRQMKIRHAKRLKSIAARRDKQKQAGWVVGIRNVIFSEM